MNSAFKWQGSDFHKTSTPLTLKSYIFMSYDNVLQNQKLCFKKKKKARKSRKRERSLDSCQLIKNNECSRGFNFLPSQQPAQSQQTARRGREQAENTLFISAARPVPPNNCTPASDKATLLLACWVPSAKGQSTRWMTAWVCPILQPFPWSLTQSHARLTVLWLMMQTWSVKSP